MQKGFQTENGQNQMQMDGRAWMGALSTKVQETEENGENGENVENTIVVYSFLELTTLRFYQLFICFDCPLHCTLY